MNNGGLAPCVLVTDEGFNLCSCVVSGLSCAVCKQELAGIPAMLLYRPPEANYDMICRDCTMVILRAANVRLEKPEYTG